MNLVRACLLVGCLLAGICGWAQKPELVVSIEHSAEILDAVFSPNGEYVLTGSMDGTAKLWDTKGKLLTTFSNNLGGVKDVEFSPDGKQVGVVSEYLAVIYDLQGKVLHSTPGLDVMDCLTFLPDGSVFLSFIEHESAIWDLERNKVKSKRKWIYDMGKLILSPDGQYSLSLDMEDMNDGEWVVRQGLDGEILIDDRTMGLSAYIDDYYRLRRPAIFSSDSKSVFKLNGQKGIEQLDFDGNTIQLLPHDTRVECLDVDPAGEFVMGATKNSVVIWDNKGQVTSEFPIPADQWVFLDVSKKGQILTLSDQKFMVWSVDGEEIFSKQMKSNHSPRDIFSTPNVPGLQEIKGMVNLDSRKLTKLSSPDGKLRAESSLFEGTSNYDPRLSDISAKITLFSQVLSSKGKKVSAHGNTIEDLAFSPNGQYLLSGSLDRTAKLWNTKGDLIHTLRGHQAGVYSVGFSTDNQYAITVGYDNFTKIWELQSGKEVVSITYFEPSGWLVTSPSGLFDASFERTPDIYYKVGLETIEFEQLKDRYYEPGLLSKLMGFSDEPLRNVEAFDMVDLAPKVKLEVVGNQLTVALEERLGGIGRVGFLVEDQEVEYDINPDRKSAISLDLRKYEKYYYADKPTQIGIKTWNADEWLVSGLESIPYTAPKANTRLNTPTRLFALCIGTSNYQGESFDLSFADQDAQKVAHALTETGQSLLLDKADRIQVQVLSTANPTDRWPSKPNIRAAMAQIAEQAQPQDLFVLYLSGHGTTNDRDGKDYFYYLTHELTSGNINDTEIRRQYAISTAEWADWLTKIPAKKQVLVLDACASGTFNQSFDDLLASRDIPSSQIRALDRLRSRTGLFIISGSTADQVSYEASPFGQGLLTYSLLRGIKSGEALREGKYVDVLRLFDYAKETVPQLAQEIGGIQEPMILAPYGAESYDIGLATQDVRNRIELSEPKPIFCRVRLSNEETFDDDLGLERILNEQLRELAKQGSKARLIFVDVPNDPNAYRILGNYEVEGNAVNIRFQLRKGSEQIGEQMKGSGSKGDLERLSKEIIRKAYGVMEE